MTAEELQTAGIPLENPTAMDLLTCDAAVDWLVDNTTIPIDKTVPGYLVLLPAPAKLFIAKFTQVLNMPTGVQSESIDGLSQTFSTEDKNVQLITFARSLLGAYMKSGISVFPATRRWLGDGI